MIDFSRLSLQTIFDALKVAPLAEDLFGEILGNSDSQTEALGRRYRSLVAVCHPDRYRCESPAILAMATEATRMLNALREEARVKIERGIYGMRQTYNKNPAISFSTKNGDYRFYEKLFEGKIVDLYLGEMYRKTGESLRVVAKIARSEADNDLLQREMAIFRQFEDPKYPLVFDKVSYGKKLGLIMRYSNGVDLVTLRQQRSNGLEPKHVAWIVLEALFSLGNLHSKKVIHGSIAPNNTILDLTSRKIYFCDFFFAVANPKDGEYITGACKDYSAPEVYRKERPSPAMDIYSIGQIAINLLGGDCATKVFPLVVPQKMRELIIKMVEDKVQKRFDDAWRLCERLDLMSEGLFGANYRKAAWAA